MQIINNLIYNYLFNSSGFNHETINDFNNITHFGYRFIQGNINSPTTAFAQYYSWYIGLGINYPATDAGSHGCQFALPRDTVHPYFSVRFKENNVWRGWTGIYASKCAIADTLAVGNQTINGNIQWIRSIYVGIQILNTRSLNTTIETKSPST